MYEQKRPCICTLYNGGVAVKVKMWDCAPVFIQHNVIGFVRSLPAKKGMGPMGHALCREELTETWSGTFTVEYLPALGESNEEARRRDYVAAVGGQGTEDI